MAQTYLNYPTAHGFTWSIGSLSSIWDSANYQGAQLRMSDGYVLAYIGVGAGTGTYSTPSVAFSATSKLSANTSYTLYGFVQAANGTWYDCGSDTMTTAKEQLSTPSLDSSGSGTTTINVSVAAVSNADRYYAVCNGSQQYNSTGDFAWSGLSPSTQYQVEYWAIKIDGSYLDSAHAYANITTVDPTPGTPTYKSHVVGDKKITVTWDRPSSCAYLDGYIFFHKFTSSGTWTQDSTVADTSATVSAVFQSLTNGLSYDFRCKAYAYEGGSYYYSGYSTTVTATPLAVRPPLFDWAYAGQTAAGVPVSGTAKSASYRLYVTADEWNDLISNIMDVWTFKTWADPGLSWVSSGSTMLASQFNAVKNAIGAHNATGIVDKTADTSNILYSDFNTLRTKLNEIT